MTDSRGSAALIKRLRGGHVPRTPELDQGKGGPTGHVCGGHGWGYPPDYPCLQVQAADLIDELTLPAGEWRVSVGVDGTRTVTPLRTHGDYGLNDGYGSSFPSATYKPETRVRLWADAPENGDATDA